MKNKITIIILLISSFSFSQSIDDYIKIAVKNNAVLKVKKDAYNLTNEKKNEVSSYQNTNISLGVFVLTPETRVGSQLFKVSATQKLPWFGEFSAKKKVIDKLSEIKKNEISLSKKGIEYKVAQAYYQLYEQIAITAILKENKQILKTYENMALSALTNNRATMSDVLRIRVQKNELHSKIFQNLNSIEILSKNFNRLLQRDKNIALNIVDSLSILDISIQKLSTKNHPSLTKIKNMDAVYDAQKEVITIDKKPKITIGLDYLLVNKRTDIAVFQNGKDILMPKVSIGIPLFNKKYSSQSKQLKLQKEMLKDKIENQKTLLEIALETAVLTYKNAVLSVSASQKNKIEIQRAINVDLKAYETGILDYDKILRLQIQKIRFQLMEIKAIKDVFIAKSKIDYLTE